MEFTRHKGGWGGGGGEEEKRKKKKRDLINASTQKFARQVSCICSSQQVHRNSLGWSLSEKSVKSVQLQETLTSQQTHDGKKKKRKKNSISFYTSIIAPKIIRTEISQTTKTQNVKEVAPLIT